MLFNTHKNKQYAILLCCLLTACEKQPTVVEDNSKKETVTETKPYQADFIAQTTPLTLQQTSCDNRRCAEFSVAHLRSNQNFIDQTLEQATLDILKQKLDLHFADESTSNDLSTTPNQANNLSFNEKIQHCADAFFQLDQAFNQVNTNMHASFVIQIEQQAQVGQVVTIVLKAHDFLGGAHGSNSQHYFVFDLAKKQQLTLKNILRPNQDHALKALVHTQFKDWVILEKLADRVQDYEQVWPFKLSHNFYFNDNGLVLQYNEYDIAPYAMGTPSFTIPYTQLEGILQPQFLPTKNKVL